MKPTELFIELVARLMAIRDYAKDIHYSVVGSTFYGEHLFADRISDDVTRTILDDIKEICILGRNNQVPQSQFFTSQSLNYFPITSRDENYNYMQLRESILEALMVIEKLKMMMTTGESNLIGGIAQSLQQNYGLLCLRLNFAQPLATDEVDEIADLSADNKAFLNVKLPSYKYGKTREEVRTNFLKKAREIFPNLPASNYSTLSNKLRVAPPAEVNREIQEFEEISTNKILKDVLTKEFQAKNESGDVFKEEDHPRDADGKFSKDGGAGKTSEKSKETKSLKKLPQEAQKIYASALKAEPEITKQLTTIADTLGTKMVGLDFRTKSPESTERKVLKKSVEQGVPVEDVISDMYDLVRYTQENTTADMVRNYNETVKNLEKSGYRVIEVKNTFTDPNSAYKGLNLKMQDPTSNKFELQFHTPQSLEVKEKIHTIYEEQRKLSFTDPRFKALNDEMIAISKDVKIPDNMATIKNYRHSPRHIK